MGFSIQGLTNVLSSYRWLNHLAILSELHPNFFCTNIHIENSQSKSQLKEQADFRWKCATTNNCNCGHDLVRKPIRRNVMRSNFPRHLPSFWLWADMNYEPNYMHSGGTRSFGTFSAVRIGLGRHGLPPKEVSSPSLSSTSLPSLFLISVCKHLKSWPGWDVGQAKHPSPTSP